ncbi:hypothetical protein MVEG_01350 [Paramuricea clavata]|uniref:Uncharacterized protein n=2 Tax=Paramuricea clavata TaxID=317549 RepID=A0A6S7FKS3_PARCT|nr:hypothetical protein MVEG_01350 [Paramuricea clavata]
MRYVPIQPKPDLAVLASVGVATASSKNVVTSVAMPTNCQLPLSGLTGIDLRQLLCNNTPALDLSLSSIVVAPPESTTPVQNSGNMLTQGPLSAVTFLNESWPPVSVSGNSTAHGSSLALAIDSGTETIPPVHSSGNIVTQSQVPTLITVSQAASSPPFHSLQYQSNHLSQLPVSGMTGIESRQLCNSTALDLSVLANVVAQTESTLSVQNYSELIHESMPTDSGSGNLTEQGPSSTSDIVHDTETSPADHSFGDMVTESPVLSEATNLEQPTSDTLSPFTVDKFHQAVEELSQILKDDSMNVDTNTNMMEATETGSQPSNEVRDAHDHLSTPSPNFSSGSPASNKSVLSPISDVFSDIDNKMPLEQYVDSLSSTEESSNMQVPGTTTCQVGEGEAHLKRSRFDTPSQIAPLSSADGAEQNLCLENLIEDSRFDTPSQIAPSSSADGAEQNLWLENLTEDSRVDTPSLIAPLSSAVGAEQNLWLETMSSAFPHMLEITNSSNVQRNVLSGPEELRTIDTFMKNVKSTGNLEVSLAVLDNDALLKKLNESTIEIHTVEIQSTCKVHQVLRKYSLPFCLKVLRINEDNLNFEDISDLVRSLNSVNGLHELYLSRTKFKESSFFAFMCLLNNCKDLKSLFLTDNGLTKQEITCLITAFNIIIENLTLSKSNLTETQANDILQKHGQAENIVSLDLSQNAIQGNEIIIGICQLQSLEELNLSHNYIRFSPLPTLEQKRDNLSENTKIISLASNNMLPVDICQFRSLILSNLLKLNLDFNHVGNSIWSLCSLGLRIKHLKVLSLASTDIFGAVDGLANLLSLVRKLEELNLSSNNLMANDFRVLQSPLSKLTQLKTLNLSNNPEGISALLQGILPSLKYLEELRLSNTHLNSEDLSKICDSLASLSSLKYLDLSMNAIGSDGSRTLADILKGFPLLEGLDISRSYIKEDDISVLCKGLVPLKKVKYLNLSGNHFEVLDDNLFLPPTLEELIFSDIFTHGEKLFAKMKQLAFPKVISSSESLRYLKNLDLHCTKIRKPIGCQKQLVAAVGKLKYLKELGLHYTYFTKTGTEALADVLPSLQLLEKLVLGRIYFDDGCQKQLFAAIKKLKYLKELGLRYTYFTKTGAEALADVLPSLQLLEKLVLGDIAYGCQKQFAALEKLKYFKELIVLRTRITQTDTEALADVLPSLQLLKKLVLGRIDAYNGCEEQLFAALGKLKYLKEINFQWTGNIKTDPEALAEVLPSLQLLEKLALGSINFAGRCQKQLFAALGKLKYLKELNFQWTRITQTGAEALADVLPSLQLLEKLALGKIDFADRCQKQLFGALGKLKYLKELNFHWIRITQTGAEALAEVLSSLQLLEKLSVGRFSCNDAWQEQLFAALGKLKYLKELHVFESHITQTGAEALAKVLPSLQLLEKLVLQCTSFHNESDQRLFTALRSSSFLTELHLGSSIVSENGAATLTFVLPTLPNLKRFGLPETLKRKLKEEMKCLVPGLKTW